MLSTIIIDDEVDSQEVLALTIQKYFPELSLNGVFGTPEEGLDAIRSIKPDLVFLDIQMPHLSGFDLLKQLLPISFEVIFVTAHDQYAIKAIRFGALDYLLKPVDIDDLRNAIERVKERRGQASNSYQYQSIINNAQHKGGKIDKLAVPTVEGIEFFNTEDIIFCQAEGSYTNLFLKNKKTKLVSKNLKDFENLLTSSDFCRTHHSFLINLKHVHRYIKGEGGYVILTDGHHVDISRRKKEEFIRLLDAV